MKRLLPIALLVLVAAFSLWMLSGDNGAPQPEAETPILVEDPAATGPERAERHAEAPVTAVRRNVDASRMIPPDSDPRFEAALAGFRGRVLDAQLQPVADTEVRLYRGDIDSIINPGVDVFVDQLQAEPKIDAGSTRTDDQGRFEFHRVSPRAFHLLHAACDHDDPTWRFVQRNPGPGEVVDLGDIVLEQLGILTGTVVGPEGQPLQGALVRAADLPGTVLGFVPIERLDPEGALIVTQGNEMVVTAPSWFAQRFEQLPVPKTLTDSEGRFRLTGVYPGNNLVAITKRGLQSNVRPMVMVEAGRERDLGSLRMPEGEYAYGTVVDQQGEPIEGAQVLAASESIGAPVHFASFTPPTDQNGVFELGGFPSRNAIVAARRDAGEPWVISAAQSVGQDFEITLPSRFELKLQVTDSKGEPVVVDRIQLLAGDPDRGAVELAMWGVKRPVPLKDRLHRQEDGTLRIEDLPEGRYAVLVEAEGYATKALEVKLDADEERSLELGPSLAFRVRVLDPEGEALRNASVLHMGRGSKKLVDFPRHAGRSNAKGEVDVEDAGAARVEVYARHPEFGIIEGELELPTEEALVMQFQTPAAIEGVLTASGRAPPAGEWMLILTQRGGAEGTMPRTTLADAQGQFVFRGLQPGDYRLTSIESVDALRSFGGIAKMSENMFMFSGRGSNSLRIALEPGETEQVAYDLEVAAEDDKPTVQVTGSVTLDGVPAAGHRVLGWSGGRNVRAETDAQGRFQLDQVRVGNLRLRLQSPKETDERSGKSRRRTLWSQNLTLTEGEFYDLTIAIKTTAIEGTVLHPNGVPMADAAVRCVRPGDGQAQDGDQSQGTPNDLQFSTMTGADGRFRFEALPTGNYRLTARAEGAIGRLGDVVALDGNPRLGLQIFLQPTYSLSGSVQLEADEDGDNPHYLMLNLRATDPDRNYHASATINDKSITFELKGVEPGEYRVTVWSDRFERTAQHPVPILVQSDLRNLVIQPVEQEPAHRHE